jgi:hypothetical protein
MDEKKYAEDDEYRERQKELARQRYYRKKEATAITRIKRTTEYLNFHAMFVFELCVLL